MAGALARRGQFVTVAVAGDYGKPRPAQVVQSNLFAELPSAVVRPLTTMIRTDADQFRLDVAPSAANGLREASRIAIDKTTVVPVAKLGGVNSVAGEPGFGVVFERCVNKAGMLPISLDENSGRR